ncbi:MAG: hypothetical protein AAFR58_10975 [Cyanobacteria bacterium J06627_28]
MAGLKATELKFLLDLVHFDGYRSKITKIKPNSNTPASERDKTCEALVAKGLVECSREISKFIINGPGKALLGRDGENLPIQLNPKEISALEACKKETISPGELGKKVPAEERQELIQRLGDRGLIKISESKVTEVWLSTQGKRFLREEYVPTGNWGVTATKLGYYVQFLKNNASPAAGQSIPLGQPVGQKPLSQPGNQLNNTMPIGSQSKPDKQAVLQHIRQLDPLVGNKNYLPIFHLRDKLQPLLTRTELDHLLYALQREGTIDLSSLHDQGNYTQKQMAAGIRQDNGGYLFFISVL